MDLRDRRELYNGFGETLSRSFEMALTPAVFAALGFLIDRAVGIVPVFTILFLLFALVGVFIRMWYGYDEAMKRQEAAGPWARPPGTGRAAP